MNNRFNGLDLEESLCREIGKERQIVEKEKERSLSKRKLDGKVGTPMLLC